MGRDEDKRRDETPEERLERKKREADDLEARLKREREKHAADLKRKLEEEKKEFLSETSRELTMALSVNASIAKDVESLNAIPDMAMAMAKDLWALQDVGNAEV